MRGGHEKLGAFDDVILLRVVLEEDVVVVRAWPMVDTLQDSLVILKSPL